MKTPETELPRRTSWGRLAVGSLVAVGIALTAGSPAMAGNGNKHWKKHHKHNEYNYYYYQPPVVYVHPRPVYVQPAPVYVAPPPPPPVYYYEPYYRPSVNIVVPIDF